MLQLNYQAESFFSRFKTELVEDGIFETVADARAETFSYIEGYYNRIRLHSAIGYQSPVNITLPIKGILHRKLFVSVLFLVIKVALVPGQQITPVAGGRIGDMLAVYAYDLLLGRENVEATYAARLEEFVTGYARSKESVQNSFRSRAGRVSQLTKPLADYTGLYRNEMLGNIRITVHQNTLRIKMGNIDVISTPFTEKESIRVEMLPGQGETIRFGMNAADEVDSLSYAGMKFTRVR